MSEHFKVTRQEYGLFISCSPDAVDALAIALEQVYELSRLLRQRCEIQTIQRRITIERAIAQGKISCDEMSREVYAAYLEELKRGKNEKEALARIREAFKIPSVDARGYIRDGKKLSKG